MNNTYKFLFLFIYIFILSVPTYRGRFCSFESFRNIRAKPRRRDAFDGQNVLRYFTVPVDVDLQQQRACRKIAGTAVVEYTPTPGKYENG